MCRSRGRRSSSPSRSCPCWGPRRNRRCWTDTGRSRPRWPGGWSPTAPTPSTGSWSTPGTGRRWKSGGPATASRRPCASGSGSATADARSRAATTRPWTTTPTTSWPGPTEAPPASPTSASPAANTTASNTIQPGHRPGPAKTNHPAGPHPPGGTIPASSRTGNHPTGHPASRPPRRSRTHSMDSGLPAYPGWDPDLDLPPDPDRDPNLELPPAPFPDWHEFLSGHSWPAADMDRPGWPAPPDGPYPEDVLVQWA